MSSLFREGWCELTLGPFIVCLFPVAREANDVIGQEIDRRVAIAFGSRSLHHRDESAVMNALDVMIVVAMAVTLEHSEYLA